MSVYAKIRADLVSSRQETQGTIIYVLKDPLTGRFFRVREPEFWLLQQLDGIRSPEKLAGEFQSKFGLALSTEDVRGFIARLDSLYFLESGRSEHETSGALNRTRGVRRGTGLSRLLFLKLTSFDPSPFLDALLRIYRPVHGRPLMIGVLLFTLFGLAILQANSAQFNFSLRDIFSLGSALTVIVSLALVIFLHEVAHAVTCRLHGGQVTEVGFLLLYFQPCFYTDLSGAWLFPKKSHRLAVIWAGLFMQLVTLAGAVLLWRVTVIGSAVNQVALITSIVCLVTILFNFNPLIKLDGYYFLSDWLEIPNLRSKAFAYWVATIKCAFLGIPLSPEQASQVYRQRERRIFLWYASLATIYSVALLGYLYSLAGGWLIEKLGLGGVLLLTALPLYILRREIAGSFRYLSRPLTAMKNIIASPLRVTLYTLGLVGALLLVFAAPFPDRVSGTVELRPLRSFVVSVGDAGRIKTTSRRRGARPKVETGFLNMSSLDLSALQVRTHVVPGDRVKVGDTLLALTSNQVAAELQAALSELASLEARLRLLQSPPKRESVLALESSARALESEFDQASSELRRKHELFGKNLIARNEMEEAESAVAVSRSRWQAALSEVRLSKSPPKPEEEAVLRQQINRQQAQIGFLESQAAAQVISSPIEGLVVEGAGLVVVYDDQQMEATVLISDYDIERVELGDEAVLRVRSFPDLTFRGLVGRISRAGSYSSATASFEVAILYDNPQGQLRPGMSGYAKIEIGKSSLFGLAMRKLKSLIRVEFWSLW